MPRRTLVPDANTVRGNTLPQTSPEDKPISPEEFTKTLSAFVKPYLLELFGKDVELAMGTSKESALARQNIYDRLVGRPAQTVQNTTPMAFTITLERIDGRRPDPEIIDAEVKVLPAPENTLDLIQEKA